MGFDFFAVFNVPLLAGRAFDRAHAEDVPMPVVRSATPAGRRATCCRRRRASSWIASFVTALGFGTPEEAIDKLVYRPPPAVALVAAPPPQPPLRIIGVVEDRAFSFFKTPNEYGRRDVHVGGRSRRHDRARQSR